LIFTEIGKILNSKEYWSKFKHYFQLSLILLQITGIITYILREVYYEKAADLLVENQDGSLLYFANQLSHILLVIQGNLKIY
jgi:hypothetical protein